MGVKELEQEAPSGLAIPHVYDSRIFLGNFCWASGAPGDLLTSVDGGKSSPLFAPDNIEIVVPVVGTIWQEPRHLRVKGWHHQRTMDAIDSYLTTHDREIGDAED